PFGGVIHLEGHVYANGLYEGVVAPREPDLPAIVPVVSGAHSDLVLMEAHRRFRPLGRTIDDAAGEAFDKVARLLGLGFPGGPLIEKAAKSGDPNAFPLPRATVSDRYDFSFSGLKTAVQRLVRSLEAKGEVPVNDVAASFQKAITETLAEKTARAAAEHAVDTVLLGRVVAARALLRFTDTNEAIEFQAGDGKLHAEPADVKGKGPKVDATGATWLGLVSGTLRPWLAFTRGLVIARAGLTELRWLQQVAE